MKRSKILLVAIVCMMAFAACGKKSEDLAQEAKPTQPAAATVEPTQAVENTDTKTDTPAVTQEKTEIKIAALKGATAIGMVKMMADAETGTTANNYTFTIAGAADEISTGLVKGEFNIAAVPCNLASVLYNKTQGKIKVAGVNTLGVLYVIETGDTIQTVEDLKGKTIYATGLGTVPQYTLNYLLSSYGIDPEKDITIEYKTEPTEVAAILSESEDAVAMLPQPYVTSVLMNNDKARIALDIEKEWEAVSKDDSSVVTGVVVVNSDFLENNKEEVEAFMEEYSASAGYANESVEETAVLLEKFDIFKAAVAKQAIPYCNIVLIRGDEMKTKINGYLSALYAQNPKSVGGKLPADDFYYMP